METWPVTLPYVNSDFSYTSQAVDMRSKIDEALVNQRQRCDGQQSLANVSWQMTNDQLAAFEVWHKYRINGGNDWFFINLPIDGTDTLCRARLNNGTFSLAYKEGKQWLVTAKLDIDAIPNNITSAEQFNTVLDTISGLITDDSGYLVDDQEDAIFFNV